MYYGANYFDPALIASQMVQFIITKSIAQSIIILSQIIMQAAFYLIMGVLILIVFGLPLRLSAISLDLVFSGKI